MGSKERKEKEKMIRRKDIIDAAEYVFFQNGYEKSTMDDVAKQAEFSKRTLYVYFKSKEQIYFEIMVRGYRLLITQLQERMQGKELFSAQEKLREIADVYYQFSIDYSNYFQAIMEYENSVYDFQQGIPDASRDECYQLGEIAMGMVKDTLQEGRRQGTIRTDITVDQMAMTLWACMLGIFGTAQKKQHYIENYYNTHTEKFIQEAFHMLIRSLQPSNESI